MTYYFLFCIFNPSRSKFLSLALATIGYIQREKLWLKAEKLREFGKKYLKDMMHEKTLIGDVRGEGLMMAVELVRDRKTQKPAPEEIERVEASASGTGWS